MNIRNHTCLVTTLMVFQLVHCLVASGSEPAERGYLAEISFLFISSNQINFRCVRTGPNLSVFVQLIQLFLFPRSKVKRVLGLNKDHNGTAPSIELQAIKVDSKDISYRNYIKLYTLTQNNHKRAL